MCGQVSHPDPPWFQHSSVQSRGLSKMRKQNGSWQYWVSGSAPVGNFALHRLVFVRSLARIQAVECTLLPLPRTNLCVGSNYQHSWPSRPIRQRFYGGAIQCLLVSIQFFQNGEFVTVWFWYKWCLGWRRNRGFGTVDGWSDRAWVSLKLLGC
jgi:hypothetical protein